MAAAYQQVSHVDILQASWVYIWLLIHVYFFTLFELTEDA